MNRLRVLRFFAAGGVAALTALVGASAAASTSAPHLPPLIGPPAGKFVHDLENLPSHTETVTFKTGTGPQTHTFTGPLLLDVLA